MSYTPYQIPGLEGLLGVYGETQRDRAGMGTGLEIAQSYGFEDANKYSEFFNPMDLSYIEEGLGNLPLLQKFLHGNAQSSFINNMGLLGRKMGRTGLRFGSNDYAESINRQFSNEMLSGDKEIQGIVDRFRGLLGDEFSAQQGAAERILAGGAKLTDPNSPWAKRGQTKEEYHQQLYRYKPSWAEEMGGWG